MNAAERQVLEALRNPEGLVSLRVSEWDDLLRRARNARVLPRLAIGLSDAGLDEELPPAVQEHLGAERPLAAQHARVIRWEVNRIRHALRGTRIPIVLLKGAAYVMARLPAGRGRLMSDVDFMVPRARLDDVEQALLEAGWEAVELHPYDQRYYRTWSHELPPLRHRERDSVVDVHHTILPVSGRLHPDPGKLLAASRPVDGESLRVLSPEDMVLHAAVHLFQDGDLAGGLREVIDLDRLMRHFGASESGFWDRLVPRALELGLQRPLFYALRFTGRLLGTPVPEAVSEAARVGRPPWPVTRLMDTLATRALLQDVYAGGVAATAHLLLYIRAHWMRMPPWLLVRHLTRKAWRRWFESEDDA